MLTPSSTFADALGRPGGRAILVKYFPGIAASPMADQFADTTLDQLVELVPGMGDDQRLESRLCPHERSRLQPHYPAVCRLFTVEGVEVWARRCVVEGRGLPMMGVLTLSIWKTSTCPTLPSRALM